MSKPYSMKVAMLQLNAGVDKKKNVARAVEMVREAAARGARVIALPEVFNYRGPLSWPILEDVAERIPGDSLLPLISLARQAKAFILAGSIYERIPGERKVYNTSVLLTPRGQVSACYRKIHLFSAQVQGRCIRESQFFKAGIKPTVAQADSFLVGLSICYDLRFPELFRSYGTRGCQVLFVPSSFTQKTGEAHWKVLLRARAIENLAYVVAPNQVGHDGRGVATFGHSMVVSPWGEVLVEASAHREEIVYANIERPQLQRVRKILPQIFSPRP